MNARLLTAAVAVIALSLLAACGDASGTEVAGADAPVEVTFVVFGDPIERQAFQAVAEAFTAENPDVVVRFGDVATQDELLARLTTSAAGGDAPDIVLLNYRKIGPLVGAGALQPIGPMLERSDVLSPDDFYPEVLDAFRQSDGDVTCMPQNVSSLAVYYNADLFAAAGVPEPSGDWTWDELLDVADRLSSGDVAGVGTEASLIRLAPFVWQHGGEIVDDLRDPTVVDLSDPAGRQGVELFLRLAPEGGAAEALSEGPVERFMNGRLAMLLESRRVTPELRTIEGFSWDVAPLPVAAGGQPAIPLHSDGFCLTAASEHPDEAWRFIEFAMSRAGQTVLSETGRTVPARRDLAESDAFLGGDPPSSHVWIDAVPHLRPMPSAPRWPQTEQEIDRILEEAFLGRLDVDATIDRIREVSRRILQEGAG